MRNRRYLRKILDTHVTRHVRIAEADAKHVHTDERDPDTIANDAKTTLARQRTPKAHPRDLSARELGIKNKGENEVITPNWGARLRQRFKSQAQTVQDIISRKKKRQDTRPASVKANQLSRLRPRVITQSKTKTTST